MTQEIELKLVVAPSAVTALNAHSIWEGHSQIALSATYFDTADLTLNRAGLSLRLRQGVQTLKADLGFSTGLFDRGEWDRPTSKNELEIAAFKGTPLEALKLKPGDLLPIIQVDMERWSVPVAWNQSQIALSLDQGTIWADSRQIPLHELELELISGQPADLFDLAQCLGRTIRLVPSLTSKAGRGYALLSKAGMPPLDRTQSPDLNGLSRGEAFQLLARNSLSQVISESAILLQYRQPQAVHQMRVALRRLRALISLFGPVIDGPDLVCVRKGLKLLAQSLGPARDLDVLISNLVRLDPAPQALIEALEHEQGLAYDVACDTISGTGFGQTLLAALAWIEVGDWRRAQGKQGRKRDRPVAHNASKTLSRLRSALKQDGRDIKGLSTAKRHALRIRTKKLRYALDMFSSLFEPHKSAHLTYLKAVKMLQDQLGAANDRAMGLAMIEAHAKLVHITDIYALAEQLWPENSTGLAAAQKTLDAALRLPRYWLS